MDSKKDAFRKYLESAGVVDALTKVLVALYEEPDRPKGAIDFMKTQLGGPTPQEYQTLLAEKEVLLKDLEDAKQREQELKQRVQELESAAGNS